MGLGYSSYYDLVRLRELGPESKDWAVTDKNFQVISLILKAFENHKHTGNPGTGPPSKPVTITIGSPTVVNLTNHGYLAGQVVYFFTTVLLPTGMSVGTPYFVLSTGLTANSFEISATSGGAPLITTGTQVGTQSVMMQPILTEQTSGGSLAPGTTVGVRLSYTNSQGLETLATTETDLVLSVAALKPLTPTLLQAQPAANALTGGTYLYVMTKLKSAGETVASDALPVSIAFDQTYSVTLTFDSISTYTDGTTQLNIYRSSGLNSSFQLVGEITDVNASGFTDINTSVDQTQQPPSVSTFDNTKAVLIDWTAVGSYPTDAVALNIYVTQQPGVWGTNNLLTSISLASSPPTQYTYLGSESLQTGYPYDTTQIPNQPGLIDTSQATTGLGGTGAGGGAAAGAPPVGAQISWTGGGDPPFIASLGQWVVADGRLIDRTVYSTFFTTTGHAYNGGVDPGAGQVRIPDKRGKKSIGALDMGTGAATADNSHVNIARGSSAGEVNHTTTNGEMPVHGHGGATGTSTTSNNGTGVSVNTNFAISSGFVTAITPSSTYSGGTGQGGVSGNSVPEASSGLWGAHSTSHGHGITDNGHTHTQNALGISNDGGGGAHNNVDPAQADSYIVRIL